MPRIWSGVAVVGVVAAAAGCGGARSTTVTEPAGSAVPAAPLALGLPADYRARQVVHANLSGGPVPDVVVTSVGPPVTQLGFHSADLRVLEWDPLVHRWDIAFDAQEVEPQPTLGNPADSNSGPGYYPDSSGDGQTTPLLDPKADVTLGPVRTGRLLPGKREQLVFSASESYGGSGVPGVLAVVDFKGGLANLVYTWSGEGLRHWQIAKDVLHAQAAYWTPADPHCCAIRNYDFAAEAEQGYLTEVADQRPWLGITVRQLGGLGDGDARLEVRSIDDNAPAKGHLRVGDVLEKVLDPPAHRKDIGSLASPIFDELALFDAGQTAKLLVRRAGSDVVVAVPLGSLKDSYGEPLPSNDYAVQAL
jgi:hypothetical protein